MQLSDIIAKARLYANEPTPSPSGRWADTDIVSFINDASLALGMDWRILYANATTLTTAGAQEYQLPPLMALKAVYIGTSTTVRGQRLIPTTKEELEGNQIQMYDSSTPGTGQPKWVTAAAQNYPITSSLGGNGTYYPTSLPFFPNRRPSYYRLGGVIGIVPAPANVVTLWLDIVPFPKTLVNNSDLSDFPNVALEALAWRTVAQMKSADQNASGFSPDEANYALARYEKELARCQAWEKQVTEDDDKGIIVQTYRSFWPTPNAFNNGGSWDWDN